ncbi:MAG: tRNA (adenosine(37)-N6)-threonylcarbamoyltransferase complex ATPase subunit type 1 TsaE [Anaerolineae bacterium]|nr:tRNA (adenosine(37)-N6)-threonylcarbamoyltransferase complex ATPase subunit type 1 TsaE [Anaerolineae bacterium]
MPILLEGELDIITHSAAQSARFGARLGKLLQPSDIICLSGDMGTGKTIFATGIGHGWGAKIALTSPTYNLVHPHKHDADKTILYHLDCYRLQNADDTDSIGLDDILDSDSIAIIEWAERIDEALPHDRLWVDMRVIEDMRRSFRFQAEGERYQQLIDDFRAAIFGIK